MTNCQGEAFFKGEFSLEWIKVENYQQMSELAAKRIIELVQKKPNAVLGLATGSTPIGTYELLAKDHVTAKTSYRSVTTFNLDEYIGLEATHPQSYRFFMEQNLFQHLDILPENIHIPNGMAEDTAQECERYEKLLVEKGPVDLQILGIGENGHIGFNEPGTAFDSKTDVVELTESTREANKRFFQSIDEVPTHAITMGIDSIMKSKEILLLISGPKKAEIVRELYKQEPTEEIPATVLKKHPNVTVIADEEAMKLLK